MKKVDEQRLDRLHKEVKKNLQKYLGRGVFSAASLAFAVHEKSGYADCFINAGASGEKEEGKVDQETIFDLASLTKPLVTLPSILHLIDEGKVSWNEPLDSLLEKSLDERFKQVELYTLLSHCSGFRGHRNFWKLLKSIESERKYDWLLHEILEDKLAYKTGSRHIYSDVGYLLLGAVVRVKSGLDLDEYWKSYIAGPADLGKKLFFRQLKEGSSRKGWVSTGYCSWSKRPLIGLVHDDNCRALGGVAGHAGLFGSSEGVLEFCKQFLDLYHHRRSNLPLSSESLRRATVRVGKSDWSCGFSLPAASGSSSGTHFSEKSIGHLGFTGVSFWIDVDKQVVVTLLTNRVRQGEDMRGIREARPALHDVVMGYLTGKKNPPA
ncbi:MAG: serine hydrolase [Desulfofustis sp.]|nr:serine hydrolase [Desulfofustis sp.]